MALEGRPIASPSWARSARDVNLCSEQHPVRTPAARNFGARLRGGTHFVFELIKECAIAARRWLLEVAKRAWPASMAAGGVNMCINDSDDHKRASTAEQQLPFPHSIILIKYRSRQSTVN
jgi:hypothetical protein